MSDLLDKHKQSLLSYYLPKHNKLEKLESLFFAFSDVTRLSILFALSITPMCVSDLAQQTKINRTTVSHQLTFLKKIDFVSYKRVDKNNVYYISNSIVPDLLKVGTKGI